METIKYIICIGLIPNKYIANIKQKLVFQSCTYGKSNVRPTGKSTVSTISNIIISKPEDLGHMDCFIYKLSGRFINLIGTPTNCKYTCGLLSKDCF